MPAANSARAALKSPLCPSGSKIGPGDMNSRFAFPGGVTLKPPNGGVSFCKPSSADLRSSGSFASAARLVMDFGSTPSRCFAQPGAVIPWAICAGSRANRSRSRAEGSRVSRESKWSGMIKSLALDPWLTPLRKIAIERSLHGLDSPIDPNRNNPQPTKPEKEANCQVDPSKQVQPDCPRKLRLKLNVEILATQIDS